MTDEWTDSDILHRLKLRHYQPMPHGTTELLCLKAAELIERQIEALKPPKNDPSIPYWD